MLTSMTADGDIGVEGDTLNLPEINGSGSVKRTVHNQIEKKRKDRLKEDIEDIRKLIPDSNFMIKKLTHHEVMRAACEYISSLQQQNNELLLGKKDEVSVSVIEKLRKENNELKSENKKFREIIENADFPPLADLSQLVLSWKPRSSSIITSSKTCSAEPPALSSIKSEKKKKQGLTVAECLKRKSESIKTIQTTTSCFAVEQEQAAEKAVDSAGIGDLQLPSAEFSCCSAKETVTLELKQGSANRHTDNSASCQSAFNHSITSVHETNGQVISISNGDHEESISLSELIASDNHLTGLKKSDSAAACTAAVVEVKEPFMQTMFPKMDNVSSVVASSSSSDIDKQCTESLEDEIKDTISHGKLAMNISDIVSADAVNSPAASVRFEQGMSLAKHGKVEKSSPGENVSPVSCGTTPCASVSNVVPNKVSLTIASTSCSLHPLRMISLNTSSNSFSPSVFNNAVVRNSKEQVFSNLDIGNSVLGSGLVYGNFIYHNGQLVLSRSRSKGGVSSCLQYILPNVPQTVFCSPTLPSAAVLVPSPQVIPVYSFQTQPSNIFTIARVMPELTVLASTVDCVSQVLNENTEKCSPLTQTFVTSKDSLPSFDDIDSNAKAEKQVLNVVASPQSDGPNIIPSKVKDFNLAFENPESGRQDTQTECDNEVAASFSNNDTLDEYLEADSQVTVGNSGGSPVNNSLVDVKSSLNRTTFVVLNNEPKVLTTECASSKINDIQHKNDTGLICLTDDALLPNADIISAVKLPVSRHPCSSVADDYVKSADHHAQSPTISCSNDSIVSRSRNTGSVQDSVIEPSANTRSICQPSVEHSVSPKIVSCHTGAYKNSSTLEPLSTVFTTGLTTVSKYVEPTPWNGSGLTYSSNACSASTSSRPVFHNADSIYQSSPVVVSSELNADHKGYKRKSSSTCSQNNSKSQKITANFVGNISRYICPPPDAAVEKDKSLEIFVLDQLNGDGRIGSVDCPHNGFGDLLCAESSTTHCRDSIADISNSLPPAMTAVDEFWRPDAEPPSAMQLDTLRNKQELAASVVNASRSVLNDSGEMTKVASTISTSCVIPICSQDPITLFSNDKSEKAASSVLKNKSFSLASFFPASHSSLTEFSGLPNLESLVAPKSPRTSEFTHSFLADCGLPSQNFYSHVPKSFNSVMYGDSFYNSLQDDLSLTDNDLSVFLNDPDVFPVLPAKSADQNIQFWNAGIGVSNNKVREKGKDMGSQFSKTDVNASVGACFADSYRVDWNANTNEHVELSNSGTTRSCFNVTSLTGKPSSTSHSLWSYNIDQPHGSHVQQTHASSSVHFESFNVSTSLQCQITEQTTANTATHFSSQPTVSVNREIFSLARHAVSSSSNHSTGVTSSKVSRTSATAANCFWSPCVTSSYSVAGSKMTSSHSPPLYHKNNHTLSSLCTSKSSNGGSAVTKQSFWGLQIASGDNQDADAVYQGSDSRASSFHYDSLRASVPVAIQQNLLGSDVQPTTVSLSFRPQIEHEISKPNCRWSEEEFYPFPASRKKTVPGDRSCRTTVSNGRPFYPHVATNSMNDANVSLNSVKPPVVNTNNDQKLSTTNFSHYSSEGNGSSSGLGFPIGLSQAASGSVSCHKLPSFSFAAVPPIPDFMTFNFAPAVSISSNQSSTQSSTLESQWNFSSSARSQSTSRQPLTFAISNQLTQFEHSNTHSVPSSVCRGISPFHENNIRQTTAVGSSQSVVSSGPYVLATSHRQHDDFFVQPGAYSGSTTLPTVSNVIHSPCSGIANVNSRACPDSTGTSFTDYCLTSPPLHHPPVLNSVGLDNCSAKQLKLNTSFGITALNLGPPMLSFSAPAPFQPAAQIIGIGNKDLYSGISLESCNNSLSQTSHLRSQEFFFPTHGFAESHQPLKSKRSSKFCKRSPKHASDSYKVPLPVYSNQNNGLRQPEYSEMPTYLTNAPFSHNGFVDNSVYHGPNANANANECETSVSLNPVFRPSISNSLALNSLAFQPTTSGPTLHMPTSHGHLHNFGIGSIFSDLTSSSSVIASPIRDLRLPPPAPINLLPASRASSLQPHQPQHRPVSQTTLTPRVTQSSPMHNMSINSLLGRDPRALPPNQFNSAASDIANSASMSQFSSAPFDFGVYSHHL